MSGFYKIPLDLPHAGRVAQRIANRMQIYGPRFPDSADPLFAALEMLDETLAPYVESGENPPPAEAAEAIARALGLGRAIVDEVERLGWGEDRLGQYVRNLFECLEAGEEGAAISLRAGENPDSLQRP